LDLSLTENSSIINNVLNKIVSDTLNINLNDVSLVQIIALLIEVLDRLDVSVEDSYSEILSKLNRTDTLAVVLDELREIFNTFSKSDTISIGIDEARLITSAITKSDSLNVSVVDETQRLKNMLSAADTIGISLSYLKSIFGNVITQEGLDINVSDEAGSLTSFLESIDEINVQLSEIKKLIVALQTGDDLNVELTEVGIALFILLVVNSNDTIDLSAIESYGPIKSFLSRLDELGISLFELTELLDTNSYKEFIAIIKKIGDYNVIFEKIRTDSILSDINKFDIFIKRIR
jgi:hypothetical protein